MAKKKPCSWTPKVNEKVLVVLDRGMQELSGYPFPMRLGTVAEVEEPYVKVSFTNGDWYGGRVEDLRPLS